MSIAYRRCKHCEEAYPTKTARSQFCSSRCKVANSRAAAKPVVNAPYAIQNKHPSQISKERQMSVTKQREIRLRMRGIDVTILVDHRPADESLPNMTAEEIKAYVETAIANLLVTGSIDA